MANGGGWSWFLTKKRKDLIFIVARDRFADNPDKILQIIKFDDAAERTLLLIDKIEY